MNSTPSARVLQEGGSADAKAVAAPPPGAHGLQDDCLISASQLAIAELQRLLALWLAHEPGARLGEDPEELHQLRVTARRIDATLGLFKRQLPPTLVSARRATKVVLRTLGTARDLDVQLSVLQRYCARLPEKEGAAAEPLRAHLETERDRARRRMLRGLDSEPTRRWLQTMTAAGDEPAEHLPADSAATVLAARVGRRFRKLRKSVQRLRPRSTMDDYHRVRRRAKQLRYAIECGSVMLGKPADDMLKALRRLQDKLGAQQDAYMAQQRLAALAAEPAGALPPATLFFMGRLAEHHAVVTLQTRRTLTRSWRKVRGRRWKALRARLGPLHAGAATLNAAIAPAPSAPLPAEIAAGRRPEPELRTLKH
jgi:CHAD domain-containing protein